MLQTACASNATEGPDWHRVAVLARDDEPLIAIGMRPDLVRTPLADDLPPGVEERRRTSLYFFGINGDASRGDG